MICDTPFPDFRMFLMGLRLEVWSDMMGLLL